MNSKAIQLIGLLIGHKWRQAHNRGLLRLDLAYCERGLLLHAFDVHIGGVRIGRIRPA